MLNKKILHRQLQVWIMAAVSAPLAIYGGKASWTWSLAIGLICILLCIAVLKLENIKYGKILGAIQIILLGVVSGVLLSDLSLCWETDNVIMPIVLITLAVISAVGGAERNGRVCCVLAWILALLYIVSLAAGAKDIQIKWLYPAEQREGLLPLIFLIPAVAVILPREQGSGLWILLVVPLFAAIIGIWCAGTLSTKVTQTVQIPFFEYSKSLSVFGVAERFEALISVAMTAGLFCMLSLLLSSAQQMVRNGALVSGVLSVIVVWINVRINPWILDIFALFLWIVIPLLKCEKINRKKMKKVLDKWK